jgi:hypothetical protein
MPQPLLSLWLHCYLTLVTLSELVRTQQLVEVPGPQSSEVVHSELLSLVNERLALFGELRKD